MLTIIWQSCGNDNDEGDDDDNGTEDDDEDKEMKDANYKCRAQGGNASCIQSLALPLMQKELGLLII